jgi:Helitron helicase-like domain at N-terminus
MYQLYQDSMAICRFCQKPDLFLTMTANPNWPEIKEALLKFNMGDDQQGDQATQSASDRPDIVARVFNEKKDALLAAGLFGAPSGFGLYKRVSKEGLATHPSTDLSSDTLQS